MHLSRILARWCVALAALCALFPAASWAEQPNPDDPQTYKELKEVVADQLAETDGGVQTSQNTIAYDGGAVEMVFPLPDASASASSHRRGHAKARTSDVHDCPSGLFTHWYCFYADRGFGGRRLQFQDCSGAGTEVHFVDYNFWHQTSSWVDTKGPGAAIRVFSGDRLMWTERDHAEDNYVGDANNDKATRFIATC